MRLYELLESLDKDQKRVGQVGAAEKARKIGPVLGREPKQHPFKGRLVGEDTVQEVAPPGMEDWIKDRKADFKKRYGDRWQEVLYATAWKRKKNENLDQGVVEDVNTGPQIIYATGPRTMGINDVDLVFKDLRTGRIVAHVVGNNYHPGDDRLQEFAPPDRGNGGGGDDNQPKTAKYEIRMSNSKQPTYLALGDPQQDSKHKVYKLVSGKTDGPTYYGMGMTLVSNLDWWNFLEKMLGEIMWEDDAIEAGLVDRKNDGDLVFVKKQGVAEMDKSAPQPGRDGKVSHSTYGSRDKKGSDYFKGKEAPGKAIKAKQASKDALDILKKQGVAEGSLKEFAPAGGEGGDNYGGDLYDILMGFISERYPDLFDHFGSDIVDSTVSNMVVMGSFGDIDPGSEDDLEDAVSQILVQLEDDALGESKGELWYVLEPRNIGGHAARYYVAKGHGKDLKIWKNKTGAGDFIKKADAEAKAAELNKGVAEAMPMTSLTSRYVDDPKNPAFAAKQPTGKDPLDSLSGIVALRKTDPKRAFRALQDYGFRNPNDPVIVAASKIGNQVKQDLLQKKGITDPRPWDTTDEMSAMIQKSIFDYIEKNLSKTGVAEGKKKSEPEADYGPEYQEMVARVKKLAGLGPLKTVWDPVKRVYKNVPVNQKPAEK